MVNKVLKVCGKGGEERMERQCQPPVLGENSKLEFAQDCRKARWSQRLFCVSMLISCPEFQPGNHIWPIQIPSVVLFCSGFFWLLSWTVAEHHCVKLWLLLFHDPLQGAWLDLCFLLVFQAIKHLNFCLDGCTEQMSDVFIVLKCLCHLNNHKEKKPQNYVRMN